MIRIKTNLEEAMNELIEYRFVCIAWSKIEAWENYIGSQDIVTISGGAYYGNDGRFYYL